MYIRVNVHVTVTEIQWSVKFGTFRDGRYLGHNERNGMGRPEGDR